MNKELRDKLGQLKALVFTKENLFINITAEEKGIKEVKNNILTLLENIPEKSDTPRRQEPQLTSVHAGIAVPTQVSYVARVLEAPAYNDPAAPILTLVSRELSNTYLYKHIRVHGGAYGGMSSFDAFSKLFSFLSYRDPHIVQTLKIFEEAQKF